jgi:5-methylthioribose kinase
MQQTSPVTQDQIDIENEPQLRTYLIQRGWASNDEQIDIRVLGGGVSNRTVYVRGTGGEIVMKQALAKLRVKVDWFSDPDRIRHEAMGLRVLGSLVPGSSPELVFEDRPHHILAMTAVPQPHENWKTLLLRDGPNLDHVHQFARLLATIHRRSADERASLEPQFADRRFFESLRIEPYYLYTAEQMPAAADFLTTLVQHTRTVSEALVHGDYSPKNILVHNDRLILLDHEVIHFGDPAFDIGFSTTHLLSKAHHCANQRDAFIAAADEYWDTYRQTLGNTAWADELEPSGVRHTLGCLLARCRGRSPLEYLSETERTRQADVVIALTRHPPVSMKDFIKQFAERL